MFHADPADAPTLHPETYPGKIPTHSYLLCGNRYTVIEPTIGRRLPQARVLGLGPDLVAEAASGRPLPLNFALLRLNAATMNQRVPVVSVGSNAAPSQLARKFELRGVTGVVPVIRARVAGLGIAFSAHMNVNGYLPAAPYGVGEDETLVNAQVTFLDEEQLRAVDDSEPNYDRVDISGDWFRITLDNDEELPSCCIYRGKHGVVSPVADYLGPFMDAAKMAPQVIAIDQLLTAEPELGLRLGARNYDELRARAREFDSDKFKEFFTSTLTDLGLRGEDNLRTGPSSGLSYGQLKSEFLRREDAENSPGPYLFEGCPPEEVKWVASTPAIVDRKGGPIAQISSGEVERMGRPRHVAIVRPMDRRRFQSTSYEIRVIAEVRELGDVDDGEIRVDQVLRHGLGVEIREQARVVPVVVPKSRGIPLVARRYVMMRVQVANINTVEQQACFMSAAELDLLGIVSGDVVVVEGCIESGDGPGGARRYEVASLKLKAYTASEEVIGQRRRIAGGGINSRYPSARDALGVYPDLPWIFLDSGSRALVGTHKVGVVRVRAGRWHQLSKEMRELAILLMLAAVGACTQLSNALFAWILVGVSAVASVLFVLLRMRARLSSASGATKVSRPYEGDSRYSVE